MVLRDTHTLDGANTVNLK